MNVPGCFCVLVGAAALLSGAGCSTKNPEWLTAPSEAYCATQLDQPCLKDFARQAYTDATAKVVNKRKTLAAQKAVVPAVPEAKAVGEVVVGPVPVSDSKSETVTASTQAKESIQADIGTKMPDQAVPATSQATVTADPVGASTGKENHPVASENPGSEPASQPDVAGVSKTAGVAIPKEVNASDPTQLFNDNSIPELAFGAGAVGAPTDAAPGYTPSDKEVEFRDAGALLQVDGGAVNDEVIEHAKKIINPVLRADVLSRLLTLYSHSMSSEQINAVLNSLYELNQEQYSNALIVKLPVVLKLGDWERAKALRTMLLEAKPNLDSSFSMLAFVASCYTMAGLKQDATAIIVDAVRDGAELSDDDKKLIGMAIDVGSGSYPMMQDFYDYRSDEVRLQAYLTIAVIARQLGYPNVEHRSFADAVKFIQKSSVKLDRQKALGQILTLSPGVL
jgi:hypothetical protein